MPRWGKVYKIKLHYGEVWKRPGEVLIIFVILVKRAINKE
jgi:hypothetical protein